MRFSFLTKNPPLICVLALGGSDTGNQGVAGGGDSNVVRGTFRLAFGGPDHTGTLESGDYIFEFSTYLMIRAENDGQPMSGVGFGSGNGQFQLSLDRLHPEHPHVHEAGSTLAMLDMALCPLCGIARRI